eukprot:scaffold50381_cov71-Phaeocystis_antarctica.AAC.2
MALALAAATLASASARAAFASGVLATCSAASSAVTKQPRWSFLPSRATDALNGFALLSRCTDTLR